MLTYTDAEGTEHDAAEYVARDRGDAPCSRYGTRHDDYAPFILALARIFAYESGEMTTDTLDHCASLVVNDHADVALTLWEHGTDEDRAMLRDRGLVLCPDCGESITLRPSGWWTHDGLPDECWRLSMDGPNRY